MRKYILKFDTQILIIISLQHVEIDDTSRITNKLSKAIHKVLLAG